MGNVPCQVALQWMKRLKDKSCFLMQYSHSSLACEQSKSQFKLGYKGWLCEGIKWTVIFHMCQVLWKDSLQLVWRSKAARSLSNHVSSETLSRLLDHLHTLMWNGDSVRGNTNCARPLYINSFLKKTQHMWTHNMNDSISIYSYLRYAVRWHNVHPAPWHTNNSTDFI